MGPTLLVAPESLRYLLRPPDQGCPLACFPQHNPCYNAATLHSSLPRIAEAWLTKHSPCGAGSDGRLVPETDSVLTSSEIYDLLCEHGTQLSHGLDAELDAFPGVPCPDSSSSWPGGSGDQSEPRPPSSRTWLQLAKEDCRAALCLSNAVHGQHQYLVRRLQCVLWVPAPWCCSLAPDSPAKPADAGCTRLLATDGERHAGSYLGHSCRTAAKEPPGPCTCSRQAPCRRVTSIKRQALCRRLPGVHLQDCSQGAARQRAAPRPPAAAHAAQCGHAGGLLDGGRPTCAEVCPGANICLVDVAMNLALSLSQHGICPPGRAEASLRGGSSLAPGEQSWADAAGVQAYGFRNIQTLVQKLKRGVCAYDYVEVMACPSGCLNGGGQVRCVA